MATDRPWAGSNLTRFLMTAEVCFRVAVPATRRWRHEHLIAIGCMRRWSDAAMLRLTTWCAIEAGRAGLLN
jgi:hypothetical protein